MKNVSNRIAYFCPDNGGCTYYRSILPFETIEKLSDNSTTIPLVKNMPIDEMAKFMRRSDVIMMQRTTNTKGIDKVYEQIGKPVIIDYDDNFECISPYSIHYKDWGTEEVTHILSDGRKVQPWEGGRNGFNIARNKSNQEILKDSVRRATAITTTTEILAEHYRQYNSNVHVLPNSIDFDLWKPLPKHDDGNIYLLWAGAASHYPDVVQLKEPLEILFKKYSNLHLKIFGTAFKGFFKDLPQDRVHEIEWCSTDIYPYKMIIENAMQTIGLVPLDHELEFNKYKSNLKYLEYSSLKVPSVVTDTLPYNADYNGKNMYMVKDNEVEGWVDAISMLIDNKNMREELADNAYNYCKEHYDIKKTYKLWEDVYMNIKNKQEVAA